MKYKKYSWYISHGSDRDLEESDVTNLEPSPHSIEDVAEGDLIVNKNGYYRRILGRVGKVVFTTLAWKKREKEKTDAGYSYSIQNLIDDGYTIVDEEEPTETETVLGKKYKKSDLVERLKELKEIE